MYRKPLLFPASLAPALRRSVLALAALPLAACNTVVMNPSGDIARQQADLVTTSTLLMLLIIVPVILLTLLFAWRYRQTNQAATYTPDWDHSTKLELIIWGAPLLIIIALGEAVLVTGATYASLPHDGPTTAAFVTSFVGSATLWWIYFDIGAKRASSMISASDNVGFIARNAYTYLHMPIVAGIIVIAVADAKMLAAPAAVSDRIYLMSACGGPILFLFGNQMFKWVTSDQRYPPLSHFVGNILLLAVAVAGYFGHWQTLTVGLLTTLSLILAAQWEWFSLHGGWQRWAPWLGALFGRTP